jgi:hypothetical protein
MIWFRVDLSGFFRDGYIFSTQNERDGVQNSQSPMYHLLTDYLARETFRRSARVSNLRRCESALDEGVPSKPKAL